MSATALAVGAGLLVALAAIGYGPELAARVRDRSRHRQRAHLPSSSYDPGRERRAERKARELLRSVVSAAEYEMYVELGFVSVEGGDRDSGYAYLLYPHRPIVAYDTERYELLSEYCVGFSDRADAAAGERLPPADDVLAKWLSLRGGERELVAVANMHLPGRQIDPDRVRRDLSRLRGWRVRRARSAA